MKRFLFATLFFLALPNAFGGFDDRLNLLKTASSNCPKTIASLVGKPPLSIAAREVIERVMESHPESGPVILEHARWLGLRGPFLWDAWVRYAGSNPQVFVMAVVTEEPRMLDLVKHLNPSDRLRRDKKGEMVTLRTGETVPDTIAASTFARLDRFSYSNPNGSSAMLDLLTKCRNPGHLFSDKLLTVLKEAALVNSDGSIPEAIRRVIVASVSERDGKVLVVHPLSFSPLNEMMGSDPSPAADDQVPLRKGSTASRAEAEKVFSHLQAIMDGNPILFNELVFSARQHRKPIFPGMLEELEARGLINSDGEMPESVRKIVDSSAEGESIFQFLVNPIAGE